MTEAQRQFVLRVRAEEWEQHLDVPLSVIAACRDRGWVRCDHDHLRLREARWTVTPDGIAAVDGGA